jgi:hypothetical protein
MEAVFADASLMAWHDLEKKRFSCHDFRDFLQSKLESAGINANIISPFLAHQVKGTDFHYSSHEVDELGEKFKIALPFLLPQTVEKVKSEYKQETQQLEKEIQKLRETVELLYPKKVERNIITDKGKETYIETFSTPEEYVESERKFMREVLLRGKSKEDQERLKDSVFVFNKTGMTKEQVEAEAKKLKQKGLK